MNQIKRMLEDLTSISCSLCRKVCGQKDCSVHRKECMNMNFFTAKELVKRGWINRDNEVMEFCLVETKDIDELTKALEDLDLDNIRVIVKRINTYKRG
jgi:hypothetical protein